MKWLKRFIFKIYVLIGRCTFAFANFFLYETRKDSISSLRRIDDRELSLNDITRLATSFGGSDPEPRWEYFVSPNDYQYIFFDNPSGSNRGRINFARKVDYTPMDGKYRSMAFLSGSRDLWPGDIRSRKKRDGWAAVRFLAGGIAVVASLASIFFGYETLVGNRPYLQTSMAIVTKVTGSSSPERPLIVAYTKNVGKRPASEISGIIFLLNEEGTKIESQRPISMVNDLGADQSVESHDNTIFPKDGWKNKLFVITERFTDPLLRDTYEQAVFFRTTEASRDDGSPLVYHADLNQKISSLATICRNETMFKTLACGAL